MMNVLKCRRFSTLIDSSLKSPNSSTTQRMNRRNPIPIPHRTIPEPRGQDLDYINVAHSHLLHSDWAKLDTLASGLNQFRLKHILLKVHKDCVLSLDFFKWVERRNPGLLMLETYVMILHVLTKHKKFGFAELVLKKVLDLKSVEFPLKLFDALVHSYRMCDSSPRVFDLVFKTYAHLKKFRCARDVFSSMRGYGFLPTVRSCNAFMSSLMSADRADVVLVFYKEMQRSRISSNVYTLNLAIGAFCKLGKLEKAVAVFREMESLGFNPNVASYNTLIAGYCKRGLLSSGLKLKDMMERRGVCPSEITYNILIHGFCKEGKLQEANKLFNEMKRVNVTPNTVTYNTLINGYSQVGKNAMCNLLFEEMCRNSIKADILTYNALILGLCNEGKTKKAAFLVKELDKKNLVPNASTFSALITGQCVRNNPERAFQLYQSMIKSGCHPNGNTLKILMSAFCKNEDYDGGVNVLKEMMMRLIIPDAGVLVDLFNGLRLCEKDALILELEKEMENKNIVAEASDTNSIIFQPITDGNGIKA